MSQPTHQPSPYTPGAVAAAVPGREQQLDEIGERGDYMLTYQRAIPRIRIDHAPRGCGKTPLLAEVGRQAEARWLLVRTSSRTASRPPCWPSEARPERCKRRPSVSRPD